MFLSLLSFVKLHLNCGEKICKNPENVSSMIKLEQFQYQNCFTTTGAAQVHIVGVFIKNWDLNLYKVGVGIEK